MLAPQPEKARNGVLREFSGTRRKDVKVAPLAEARIVVIEDEPAMREMLRLALEREGYSVRAFPNGAGLDDVVRAGEVDLVVLDVALPGADGFALLERVRRISGLPVVMLTARDETADKVRALGAGADDYVTKPFVLDELLARISAALRRPHLSSGAGLRFSDLSIDLDGHVVRRGQRRVDLTPREFALLEVLARTPERAFGKEELFERVWGWDHEGESAIVDRYVSYLRAKLEAAGEPRLVQTVRGVGYSLRRAP
jgi:DNA-binding response OmpR family regulator